MLCGDSSRLTRQRGQLAILPRPEISDELALMLAGGEQVLDLRVAPCEAIVGSDVIQRQVGAAHSTESHCAVSGRTVALMWSETPSENCNTRGTVCPGVSVCEIPCNMTCIPSGSSLTVLPGATTN